MDIVAEMLDIIVSRTGMDTNDRDFIHSGNELKYFGVGHQLKISKLADTLYSTMKDVIVFVMEEMAKESDIDYKFQVPKHTSFVGSIVKCVAIDVLSSNERYKEYIQSLCDMTGNYVFDVNNEVFQSIYRDTVLKLDERHFLFADDPELISVKRAMKDLSQVDQPSHPATLESISISAEDILPTMQQSNYSQISMKESMQPQTEEDMDALNDFEKIKASSRNRIIFPYLRRLFETHKSVCVTRRRIETNVNFAMPDEEIKQAFNQKYNEIYMNTQGQLNAAGEIVRGHCIFLTLSYLKEHYSKERVDVMEQYLKEEKSANSKPRKRYLKMPSGKRTRVVDISTG
ncbi:hypothetical protein WA588_000945, partial [Blastocystis sp. NMH]